MQICPSRRRSRLLAALVIALLSLPAFSGSPVDAEDQYPTAAEARVGYEWLHVRALDPINDHPGWAISRFEAEPRPLPPGVLAQVELTPGWATFGLALKEKAAFDAVQVGSLETQTDVKSRWLDGSISFAVVTVHISQGGAYDVRPAAATSGSFTPQIPSDAHVVLQTQSAGIFTAQLPTSPTDDRWLTGPLVQEWRAVATPTTGSGTPHPFLRVLLDYRSYSNGEARWDVTVENALNAPSATVETYDVEIKNGAATLFQKSDVDHWYMTRWRKVFGIGLNASEVVPDFEPFYRAKALPRFLDSVKNEVLSTDGPDFEIMGKGGNSYENMSTTGGRGELAPYPDTNVMYIVHRTDSQREYLLANGDLVGSWPVHLRETDGSFISIDERPEFWIAEDASDRPQGDLNARGPLSPDNAHQPSWAYVPYLVTGDRYYADEMAFWAGFVLLETWPTRRGGDDAVVFGVDIGYGADASFGLLVPGNQIRGSAWGLRNMVDAAAYLPDDHPMRNYLIDKVNNNLEWMDFYHTNFAPLPLGAFPVKDTDLDRHSGEMSLWQRNYLGWAVSRAHEQGFFGGEAFLGALSGFQSKLFTSEPDYPRDYGAPYRLKAADFISSGDYDFYETMSELFSHNDDEPSNWNRDYAASARLMLMIQAASSDVFRDGFESGDLSGWSSAQQ